MHNYCRPSASVAGTEVYCYQFRNNIKILFLDDIKNKQRLQFWCHL